MLKRTLTVGLIAGVTFGSVVAGSLARAETYTLKYAPTVSSKHPMSKWLTQWLKTLEAKSGGRLKVAVIPLAKLPPAPKRYDLVRKGDADVTWIIHGFTPGLFPLTELSGLPYLAGSAEIGTKMLNDPELRRKFLDREHKGVKPLVLFTSSPMNLFLANSPVRSDADLTGKRIRSASATMTSFVVALGATPIRIPPPRIAGAMKKGTLDGALTDYGAAATAFRMAPATKHVTEIYSFVLSFCVCMNADTYRKLPADLRKLIDQSVEGAEADIGRRFDGLDPIGKRIMMKAGAKPVKLSAAEVSKFRAIGARVAAERVAALEKRGLPARAVQDMMKTLAAKHSVGSKNFWK